MFSINKNQTTINLIKHFNIPVLIIVKNELGCVNSILITILSLRINNINMTKVILNGEYYPFNNKEITEKYENIEFLDIIKYFNNLEE